MPIISHDYKLRCAIFHVQASHPIKLRAPKTLKIQDIHRDIFQLVDPVRTTKAYKEDVLKSTEMNDISGDNNNFKAHRGRVGTPLGM